MSAKNWSICPQCEERAHAERRNKIITLKQSYGTVPLEDFERQLDEARAVPVLKETMREDWSIGVNHNGGFHVRYRCSCEECGFTFAFDHTQPVPMKRGQEAT